MEHSPSWETDQFSQLTKKFSAFYGTRRFFTVLTSARHLSLSWAYSIQSPRPPPTSSTSILILSSHLRYKELLSSKIRVPFEKLTVGEQVFNRIYNANVHNLLHKNSHWSPPRARWSQSKHFHHIPKWSTVILYIYIFFFYYLWLWGPPLAMASFTRLLDHTQRRATVGRTPLDEWSAPLRDLYLTTHNRQTSMPPVGFEPTIAAGERP
jgi:hypothetical protein